MVETKKVSCYTETTALQQRELLTTYKEDLWTLAQSLT